MKGKSEQPRNESKDSNAPLDYEFYCLQAMNPFYSRPPSPRDQMVPKPVDNQKKEESK